MQDFRKLHVWQKANELARRLQEFLPRIAAKKPRLAHQLERAVESIAANIAEGCGRETRADFRKYLTTAIGETTEGENHLIRVDDCGLIDPAVSSELTERLIQIRKMANALPKTL